MFFDYIYKIAMPFDVNLMLGIIILSINHYAITVKGF